MPYNPKTIDKGAREISASGWNSFVRMHDDYYKTPGSFAEGNPILRSSTIVDVVLDEGAEDIKPYQPCRIVKSGKFMQETGSMWFIVEPVDRVDDDGNPTDRHGNYAFTLAEGVTAKGGRAVISGLAIVTVTREEARDMFEDGGQYNEGEYDSSYYIVPDETLSSDTSVVIGPVGHFRFVSWYDPSDVEKQYKLLSDDLLMVIDLNQRPTSFNATTTEDVAAATEASDIFTWESAAATPMFPSDQTSVAALEMDISSKETAYEIQVYNGTGAAVQIGEHLVSYSLEYNRFIIAAASTQTAKIGKADADIAVDATGTISIWRDGLDTTENVDAKLDWMAGTTQVSAGKEVLITWFADEGIWRITGAECE